MQLSDVDLLNPDNFVAGPPHEMFRLLRREAPVFWQNNRNGGEGVFVVSRYKDIWKASLDQATFSSARRGVILRDWNPEEHAATQGLLVNMDPPRHTKHRRIVNLGFSPKIVNRLEAHVRDVANNIIDAVAARGTCDFVTEVAAELPLQVIAEMVGVPMEDRHLIFEWSNTMIGFDDPQYSTSRETGQIAAAQLYMYAQQLAEERRKNPKDDMTTLLLNAEVDGEKLDTGDFNQFFLLLLVAGNETTRNTISGGMLALIENPEQRARLLADPSLIDTTVEEMVRWVSPVQVFVRTATRDTELHGVPIKENQRISLWYGSANRDEEMFPDGHRFDVGRTPNEHLGFGIGPHFCLGANLARLEIKVMFQELLRRLPDIELAGPVERLRSYFISGIKTMPVRFTPPAA
jgi:cytochrome P450